MSEIIEKKKVEGFLYTQGEEYRLLDLYPKIKADLPWWLRQDAYVFYVIRDDGYAMNIIVGKNAFVIEPCLYPYEVPVTFIVEDAEEKAPPLEEVKSESSTQENI